MEELSFTVRAVFGVVLALYAAGMFAIGFAAQKRITNVEDYVLAGRQLPTSFATITVIATWFGAESLMTTADEVAHQGIRRSMLDPVGISLCLLIAGLFIAGPLWRMNLLTIPDFYRRRYGTLAETASAIILVPSYFGWIAAQYLALASLMAQFFHVPITVGVITIALIATGYTIMGGMWSVTWTDAIQIVIILVGLILLALEILWYLGNGEWLLGFERLRKDVPEDFWKVANPLTFKEDVMVALTALAIGSLGNLPVQDLMQRVCSSKSDRVAQHACYWGSAGYLCMGLLPILAGLASGLVLVEVPEEGVVTALATKLLDPPLLLIFVLAITSAVLSTIVSAVLAPSAVLAHNLLEPASNLWSRKKLSDSDQLWMQRLCVVIVSAASVVLALLGDSAYELVESSYSLSLVGLFATFVIGMHVCKTPTAAILSMLSGVGFWTWHTIAGRENFVGLSIPHELVDTGISIGIFLVFPSSHHAQEAI
ncbi:MAG: sodium:solute symporter family protein [Planctomycetales bacterium]|nr:sodium:solute symporter family protein [Planctomycetales bacterium]